MCLVVSGTYLFAGTDFDNGIYLSTDNGTTWQARNNGLTSKTITALGVSGAKLFAGVQGVYPTANFFSSTNNGETWQTVSNKFPGLQPRCFAATNDNDSVIFVGQGGFISLSSDNGNTWLKANDGFFPCLVNALSPKDSNLFAGTLPTSPGPDTGAIWRRPLSEMIPPENQIYHLKRLLGNGSFEYYQLGNHTWQFGNSDLDLTLLPIMWPEECIPFHLDECTLCLENPLSRLTTRVFPSWDLFRDAYGAANVEYRIKSSNGELILRKPLAEAFWDDHKGCWPGSCFGFVITNFLFFDNMLNLNDEFPGNTNLHDIPIQQTSRDLINKYFWYQFGARHQVYLGNQQSIKTAVNTLDEIKTMLSSSTGNDRGLVLYSLGHIVNPYKVVIGDLVDTIYVYDSNYPNAARKIEVDKITDQWRYPPDSDWRRKDLFLTEGMSEYTSYPDIPAQSNSNSTIAYKSSTQQNFYIYLNSHAHTTIVNSSGDSIGYNDDLDTVFSTMSSGIPIVPLVGFKNPPIGYCLPPGDYFMRISSLKDTSPLVTLFSDKSAIILRGTSFTSSQTHELRFHVDGTSISLINRDTTTKVQNIKCIVPSANEQKVFNLTNFEIAQADSMDFHLNDDDQLNFENFGSAKRYNLQLRKASDSGDAIFEHRNLQIRATSIYQIVPDWNQLPQSPVKILVDTNMNGMWDDSLFVENRLFDFTLQSGWNLVSLPLIVDDANKDKLFPTAKSSSFAYDNGYVVCDTLQIGRGYWIKLDSTQTIYQYGVPVLTDTIQLVLGWNMIGSISEPIAVSSITSEPPGIVTSNFFGYTGIYVVSDTIYPGRGYWVKVNQDGQLILSSTIQPLSKARIKIVPTSEMPPSPPSDITGRFELPKEYRLEQNYPNPFNPITTIKYGLPIPSNVKLRIFNVLGQVVTTLKDEEENAGYKQIEWNSSAVASGIYFYRLEAISVSDPGKSFTQVRKMILIK